MITIILLIIAAASNAICDVLINFFYVSKFRRLNPYFWNPKVSYLNKWSDFDIKKEKFLGSSTVFVAFTDSWHLFKAIWLMSMILCIVTYKPILQHWTLDGVMLLIIWGLVFELLFRWLKK